MGYLKLKDAGAHSAPLNNTNRIVSARPEFTVSNPLEFTVSGGTASSPQLQHAQAGLISADTELWLKFAGQAGLTKAVVGGASANTASTTTSSSSSVWTGGTSHLAFSGANITCADTATASIRSAAALSGDFTYTATIGAGSDLTGGYAWMIGLFAASEAGSFNSGDNFAGTDSMTNKFYVVNNYSGHLSANGVTANRFTAAEGDVILIQRVSGTVTVKKNGTLVWTFTSTYTGDMYAFVGKHPSTKDSYGSVSWTVSGATTYILSSLTPAQSTLPEKAYKLRSDTSKALMALAKGATDQSFSTSDFTTSVDVASVSWAAGPELTVTGAETEIAGTTTRRLAIMLRSDITAVQPRARAAKIYIKELAA